MQYADAMYNICRRILQNQTEAEDALQDGFIKIFENIYCCIRLLPTLALIVLKRKK